MDPEKRDNPRDCTRAEQRRRLAASDKCALRLLARLRYPTAVFSTPGIAEAMGRIVYFYRRRA